MPFQPGNSGYPDLQRRFRLFNDALRIELAVAGPDALRRAARALLDKARAGDMAALTLLAERLDGKVPLPTGGSDELGPQRLHISWGAAKCEAADQRAAAIPTDATGDLPVP